MNPLTPSPRLLRKIAAHISATGDKQVLAWLDAFRAIPAPWRAKKFPHTSVVATYREHRLCGFEVWRHLDVLRNNPTRKKARLWFGCVRHGSRPKALQQAYYAAATISKMTPTELREWWNEYQAARTTGRKVSHLWRERREDSRLDFDTLNQISHAYAKAS